MDRCRRGAWAEYDRRRTQEHLAARSRRPAKQSGYMAELAITEFTDPACPFAWSAEPFRRRLEWLYGDQLHWSVRMVGLSSTVEENSGFTPEKLSSALRSLAERHHMPMDTAVRPRMSATMPACRAVVATRLHDPEHERAML